MSKINIDGIMHIVVKPTVPFVYSSIFKSADEAGKLIVCNPNTGVLRIVKPEIPVISFKSDDEQYCFELHHNIDEAAKQLAAVGVDGVIICKEIKFSTYYTGAITNHMRMLWSAIVTGKHYPPNPSLS